jgi:hypothetical protein
MRYFCHYCGKEVIAEQKVVYIASGSFVEAPVRYHSSGSYSDKTEGAVSTTGFENNFLVYHKECYHEVAGNQHDPFLHDGACKR